MAANSGSFGLLKSHYLITDDRVTIARNVWLPFVLLLLAAPGIWCLTEAFGHRHFDQTMFGLGFVGTMIGAFALVMTPWLTPGRITCTREGIVWGGATYPPQAVQVVRSMSNEVRSSRYGRYLSWTIFIGLADGKRLVLSLGNRRLGTSTEPLTTLERAMAGLLVRRP